MWILKLAWKNIWRNRNRTLITMAATFFAVILTTLTTSLQDGVFDNLVRNVVSFYSGYIQIHRNGYWEERVLDNAFACSPELEESILKQEHISGVTGRLESFALIASEETTKGCIVLGINPEQEHQITRMKDKILAGAYFGSNDNYALLGQGLLNRLKLKLNDTIVLIGQAYHGGMATGKYKIGGVLKFGSPDLNDQLVVLPLTEAQAFYAADGMLTTYVIAIDAPELLNQIKTEIITVASHDYEVMSWEDMMPEIIQHIKTDKASMMIISLVLYLLTSFGIFGTLLMMMVERKFELGMLLAIGMKKILLMKLLLAESVFLIISGCLAGIGMSVPIVFYLYYHPIKFKGEMASVYEQFGFEAIFPTSTDPENFIIQALIVLMLGLVLSLYPLAKVAQLNAVTAMKK